MGTQYISSVSQDYISGLCGELEKNNIIKPGDFQKYRVNADFVTLTVQALWQVFPCFVR